MAHPAPDLLALLALGEDADQSLRVRAGVFRSR